MRLLTKWKDFNFQIVEYLKEADYIISLEHSSESNIEQNTLVQNVDEWINKCYSYLKNSFDEVNNQFAQSFYAAKPYGSYIKIENKEKDLKYSQSIDELRTKRKKLDYLHRVLSVCDVTIQNELITAHARAAYSRHEISDLILDKLYYLYDHLFYPIQTILRGNGIVIKKADDIADIIKSLEKRGFIRAIYSRIITAQLSALGKQHIEDKRYFHLIDSVFMKTPLEIDTNIQELSNTSNHNDHGKELLMNELKGLKSLHNKLNKKNWTEALKGKLVDLETAKVINREVMKKIYLKMTNEELKFI